MHLWRRKADHQTSEVAISQSRLIWREFRRHPLGKLGLAVVGVMVLCAVFADFIAPYPYDQQHRGHVFAPLTRIRIFHEGKLMRPFVYATKRVIDPQTFRVRYVEDTSTPYPIRFFVRGPETYRLLGIFPTNLRLFGVGELGHDPRSRIQIFPFGTDSLGRCLFSRIMYGGRVSLAVGVVVVLVATPIALLIGGVSGYYGGGIDTFIQRAIEVVLSFPRLPLMLAMASVMRAFELDPVTQFLGIIAILSLLGWAGLARVVRGMFLSLREREFVQAARAVGASPLRIIVKHITPNIMTYLLVSATLTIPGAILAESSLSFLGLGIQEPAASWGMLIRDATSLANIEMYSWILIPGAFIFVTVLAFNFVGDALRDAFDPYRVV